MSYNPTSIPSLPSTADPALRHFLTAVKEALEVRLRQRGSALDAAPTYRDLIDQGLLNIRDGANIGGRHYTHDQLMGVVEVAIPAWVTSDIAPPAPTGLTVDATTTLVALQWAASGFDQYASTEVWRASTNNLSAAVRIGSTTGSTYTDSMPPAGSTYYYWIRDVANNPSLTSPFNSTSGTPTTAGPGTITVSRAISGGDMEFWWTTPTSNLSVQLYKIEYLGAAWTALDTVAGNAYRFKVDWSGVRQFRIAALDIAGNVGPWTTFTETVAASPAPTVNYTFDGEHVVLSWVAPASALPIAGYKVYQDSIAGNNLLANQLSTSFRTKVSWSSKTFHVVPVNSAGVDGASSSVVVAVTTGVVTGLNSEVVDNNVMLRWGSTVGSLPIASFELRRGATWAAATVIGRKDGGFTTVFETPGTPTDYTYWLAALDTAGNYGTASSVTARVAQPPDYVLATKFSSVFAGTKSNAVVEANGTLTLPVNTVETFATHFTSRTWATPDAQIAAGYPIYAQPGNLTGYYEEVFDYGATLAAMKVTVSYLLTTISGTVNSNVTITAATDAGFTLNVKTFTNAASAFITNFRYLKVRISATSVDDKGLANVSNLQVVLDAKLKSATGMVTCNASDVGGTEVFLTDTKLSGGTKLFVDVDSIAVTPFSTTPVTAVYDFADSPDPLSFRILLFNSAGTRVTGTASYQVRGY